MVNDSITSSPIISTIIATHNRSALLPIAVNSILSQTFQDFEIIIVDDASSDDTIKVIEDLKKRDARISSYCIQENRGPGFARNLGISHARGMYIAIMDDDDISHPERFARELVFLETNPDVVIVGTFMYKIDELGENTGRIKYPLTNEQIRWQLHFRCSVSNGSSMMRRSIFNSHAFRYSESLKIGEDWKFFIDVIQVHKIANLSDYLYSYRRYSDSITMKDPELELNSVSGIVADAVKLETGLDLPKSLVTCFIRPKLVKTIDDGLLISRITKKLFNVALTWNLTSEDKRFISENAASRLRQVWQTLNYPLRLFPYIIFSFLIDPSVVKRRLLRHSHVF